MGDLPASDHAMRKPERSFERLARELAERGDAPAPDPGEEFMPHEQWERERPAELEAAMSAEASNRAFWESRHRSLDGYVGREFPCPGILRVEDRHRGPWLLCCDVCGYETSIAVRSLDPSALIRQAGVPEHFVARRFEPDAENGRVLGACRQWVQEFRPDSPSESIPAIALHSDPGRGKSHLLSLICTALIRSKRAHVRYVSAEEMFDRLKASMDGAGDFDVAWQRILNVPVLALDDLGAARMTEWKQERFQNLVDHRFSRELPLLIATNLDPVVWDIAFGDRTNSRLRAMCLRMELKGPDRRVPGQQMKMEEAA